MYNSHVGRCRQTDHTNPNMVQASTFQLISTTSRIVQGRFTWETTTAYTWNYQSNYYLNISHVSRFWKSNSLIMSARVTHTTPVKYGWADLERLHTATFCSLFAAIQTRYSSDAVGNRHHLHTRATFSSHVNAYLWNSRFLRFCGGCKRAIANYAGLNRCRTYITEYPDRPASLAGHYAFQGFCISFKMI